MISDYIKLLRIHQWTKNLFVFLPLFFGGEFFNVEKFLNVFWVFMSFSLFASSIYCINDIFDEKYDKLHPVKKNRPIASGAVNKKVVYVLVAFMLTAGFLIQFLFSNHYDLVLTVLLVYLLLNFFYSKYLKYIAIVDVFILSVGFVLRIVAGGFAGEIVISHWIVIMTFLLALFLSFAKRRDDLVLYERTGTESRKNISKYNLSFLNQTISIIATITMVSYIMYTVSVEVIERFQTDRIYITAIFVLAGILRYLQLTIVDSQSGDPSTMLLKERFIQICILGWVTTFIYIVYL